MTADSGIRTVTRACILGIVLLTSLNITRLNAKSAYRIGILQNDGEFPPFAELLRHPSVDLTVVTYGDLAADGPSLSQFDCLLISNSPSFPQSAFAELERFIKSGKDLILLGGQSFTKLLWRFNDQWLTRDQLRDQAKQRLACPQPLFKPDSPTAHWKRHALNLETPSRITGEDQQFKIEIRNIDLWAWDTFVHPFPCEIPADHNTLTFELRTSPQTKNVVIEVIEEDKSRWMYVAPASTQWEQHVVRTDDFNFFADGSPPDRGHAGDQLNLQNAKAISIGLAFNIAPFTAGHHDISIRHIATARIDLPAGLSGSASQLKLPIFESRDIYQLSHITDVSASQEQDLLVDIPDTHGDFVGMSAVGFAYPDASRFIPLLSANDQHGRAKGLAAGLLVHYDGPYAPGQWFISGIETPYFYESATFTSTLGQIVNHLRTGKLPSRCKQQNSISKSRYLANPITRPTSSQRTHLCG